MAIRVLLGVLVAALLAACTSAESAPATTPTTTTAPATTTTTAPTTTAAAETGPDRMAEIQAIFQDLEERRLDALYRGDVEAFSAVFANEAYLERSLEAMELASFDCKPEAFLVSVDVVHFDNGSCLSLAVTRDYRAFLGPEGIAENTVVLEKSDTGWGYSYESERETWWDCIQPHPLDA